MRRLAHYGLLELIAYNIHRRHWAYYRSPLPVLSLPLGLISNYKPGP